MFCRNAREPRFKRLYVKSEDLLNLLILNRTLAGSVQVKVAINVEPGTEVIACYWDNGYQSNCFLCHNPDWPIVPNGDVPDVLTVSFYPMTVDHSRPGTPQPIDHDWTEKELDDHAARLYNQCVDQAERLPYMESTDAYNNYAHERYLAACPFILSYKVWDLLGHPKADAPVHGIAFLANRGIAKQCWQPMQLATEGLGQAMDAAGKAAADFNNHLIDMDEFKLYVAIRKSMEVDGQWGHFDFDTWVRRGKPPADYATVESGDTWIMHGPLITLE